MYFPFSYTGELVFYKPDNFDGEALISLFAARAAFTEKNEAYTLFGFPFSFSRIPIKVKIWLTDDQVSVHCKYQIALFENNVVFVFALGLMLFLFHLGAPAFAYTALISGLLFYFFNTLQISKSLKAIVFSYVGDHSEVATPELWNKQQQWMKDAQCCPACGEPKNPYAHICVSCGLHFDKNKSKFSAVNTSSLHGADIVYEVTKKKK